jgi:signal transduction histidine kinase
MENLVQPSRLQLESSIGDFHRTQLARMREVTRTYDQRELALLRTMTFLSLFEVFLFAGIGWLLFNLVHKQRQNWTQAQAARETLQEAERRAALLAQTGKIITEAADPGQALSRIAEQATGWLSNCCLIELTNGAGNLNPRALAIARTDREEMLRSLHRNLPKGLGSLFSTNQVLMTGRPLLESAVTDTRLAPLGVRSAIALPLRARGRVLGVFLIFRTEGDPYDDSDLSFAEELSHQTALSIDNTRLLHEAEQGLRMREELLSTVAHDLKNPLTSVRLNSELLRKQTPGESVEVVKKASLIGQASAEMERLIYDLLDLTKIESGRIVLDRHPYDADDLITACLNIFEPEARSQDIELVKEARPGEAIVDCDRNRILQVLSNLVGNALKFVGKKGGRIRVEALATGEGIRFSVIDNGPGIAAEQLPHIFERYWQTGRVRSGSTGLGLSIARGIVEAHGGRIWVESALQIGSRFFFTLPEARKQTKAAA